MMKRLCIMGIWLCLASMVGGLAISPAYADERAGKLEMGKPEGGTDNCRDRHEGKLLAVIIPCIEDVLIENTDYMVDQFDELVRPATYAFLTLVLVIFGVKMLSSEGDPKKDGITLLFKIAGVLFFIEAFGGFTPAAFGMVRNGIEISSNSLTTALGGTECNAEDYGGVAPWSTLDCILGELFGFGVNVVVGSSLFGLMGSALFSGSMGVTLFMAGILALVFIVKLVLRAAYTYLMAMVVLAFLIIISPLFIPLIFMSATFQYFENWLKSFIATLVQPMLLMGYVTLSFLILDKMMYDPEFGLASQLPKEEIERLWKGKDTPGKMSIMNNPGAFYKKLLSTDPSWLKKAYADNPVNPAFTGTAAVDWWSDMYSFDFRDEGISKTKKVFFAMAALALMAYLLDAMLQSIASVAQQMLQSGMALTRAVEKGSKLEEKIDSAVSATSQNWSAAAGNSGGAAGVGGFFSGSVQGFKAGAEALVWRDR